jgi:hypothetical protein
MGRSAGDVCRRAGCGGVLGQARVDRTSTHGRRQLNRRKIVTVRRRDRQPAAISFVRGLAQFFPDH